MSFAYRGAHLLQRQCTVQPNDGLRFQEIIVVCHLLKHRFSSLMYELPLRSDGSLCIMEARGPSHNNNNGVGASIHGRGCTFLSAKVVMVYLLVGCDASTMWFAMQVGCLFTLFCFRHPVTSIY